jgi:TatA/E family protein of Tat protein translocase
VFALILDSLGSTELLLILVVALIFFGPRKLPQLARSMGKGLAEFRKASDDFKRTWEREVELESVRAGETSNSILTEEGTVSSYSESPEGESPLYEPADSELVVARETAQIPQVTSQETEETSNLIEPTRKQDWL